MASRLADDVVVVYNIPMTTEDDGLLTVREVARRCHRSEETVRRWIWSGKLPARKLGNQLFVESGDLPGSAATDGITSSESAIEPLYDREQALAWLKRADRFRRRMFKKYGYFDVAAAVRESRDSH